MTKKHDHKHTCAEREAAEIRDKNQQEQTDCARRRLKIRREIEARRECKEFGISYEEFTGGGNGNI